MKFKSCAAAIIISLGVSGFADKAHAAYIAAASFTFNINTTGSSRKNFEDAGDKAWKKGLKVCRKGELKFVSSMKSAGGTPPIPSGARGTYYNVAMTMTCTREFVSSTKPQPR